MEYLTIEEKASLTGYLVLLDDKIKTCKLLDGAQGGVLISGHDCTTTP